MNTKKEKELAVLKRYLPEEFEHFVHDLLERYPIRFKIVKPRSSKLGDFKVNYQTKDVQITVNGNLNPYLFLITTVHEFAHYIVHLEHGRKAKPHGEEWKLAYAKLASEAMHHADLPKDVETAFVNSLSNIKASCSDLDLLRVLKKYDAHETNGQIIENLHKNAIFVYRNKRFQLLEKRRTRYLCVELETKKKFSFHALTEIEQYE